MSTFRDVISSSLFLHVSHCDQIEGGRQREQRPAGQWQLSAGDLLHVCFQRYNFFRNCCHIFCKRDPSEYTLLLVFTYVHFQQTKVLESLVTYIEYGIIVYFLQDEVPVLGEADNSAQVNFSMCNFNNAVF